MSNPAQSRSIEWTSFDYFVIWVDSSPGWTEERLLVHREQIRSFFMEAYHRRATTRLRFAYLEPGMGHRIVITGPAPTREEVLGADADLHSREEIEGGQQRGLDASAIAPSEVIRTAEIVEETIVIQGGPWVIVPTRCHLEHKDQRGLGPVDVARPRAQAGVSATITSSSTSTLDMDPPFDTLADPTHITINHLSINSVFGGLDDEGEYREDYDGVADVEGEVDETMPQHETAGSARDTAL
ncbi:hypothetical protein M404DRAFT_23375 [Pisolithus tinctorius Marx 270]|uniref:Uncharacterized protein n=1 Tax=Pisolithus tinctorius Marx 270 TaxID=870435 RepID=A0A0C3PIZ8_PISTI|nr:hypothetical protein M404DRAFT_23375 [Pisolithus tinctorius Marx 270]